VAELEDPWRGGDASAARSPSWASFSSLSSPWTRRSNEPAAYPVDLPVSPSLLFPGSLACGSRRSSPAGVRQQADLRSGGQRALRDGGKPAW